jgi:Secretion system C-terminal sorting domain
VSGFDGWRLTSLNRSGDKLFASGYLFKVENGLFLTNYGAFLSTDNGVNWTRILTSANIVGTVLSVGTKLIASTYDGGIIVSNDNGGTWTASNNGLTNLKTNSLFKYENLLFTKAYKGGISYSNDNGTTWRSANEGLPTKSVYKIQVSGNFLLVGTDMGIFRRPLSEFSTVGVKENKEDFNCTVFPNPTSNSLIINASDNLIGKKYAIINILGKTLKANILTNNSTELNVQNLSNGIYFLHVIGTNKTVKFVKE